MVYLVSGAGAGGVSDLVSTATSSTAFDAFDPKVTELVITEKENREFTKSLLFNVDTWSGGDKRDSEMDPAFWMDRRDNFVSATFESSPRFSITICKVLFLLGMAEKASAGTTR